MGPITKKMVTELEGGSVEIIQTETRREKIVITEMIIET